MNRMFESIRLDCTTYRDFPDDNVRGRSAQFSRVVCHDMLVSLAAVFCGSEVGAMGLFIGEAENRVWEQMSLVHAMKWVCRESAGAP